MLTDERLRELWANGFTITVMAGPFIENFARAVEAEATAELRAENERIRGLLKQASHAKTWGDAQALIDAALAAGGKTC